MIIKHTELLEIVSKFSFFLSLPGVAAPQSHNLCEAMSVGTVPILHTNYAKLVSNELVDGVNCLLFNNTTELMQIISSVRSYTDEQMQSMHDAAYEFYQDNLSEKAVLRLLRLATASNIPIALFAEHTSVRLLRTALNLYKRPESEKLRKRKLLTA